MSFAWTQIAAWRWAYVDSDTDTSVSTVLNENGVWERHGHTFDSLDAAKAHIEAWAPTCMQRHGSLPDISHR